MGKKCEEIELLIMSIFKVILVLSDVIIKQRIMRKPTFSQYYAHCEESCSGGTTKQSQENERSPRCARDDNVNIFNTFALVSILLRFIFPEHYGVYSPPVLHISGTERGKNEVDDYINYLNVLRSILNIYEIRERYKVKRVADVDMLLLAISKLSENYLDEFNALYAKGYLPSQTYLIEVSHEFCKSIEKSDKTIKGRVLEAIIFA
jgi:hypothetical protein